MWDLLIINPMVNAMLFFYGLLGHQFILAIIALTIFIRIIVFPLSLRQQRSMTMMQSLQKSKDWQDIQKKYKGDRERLAQEQMRLYREYGVNPAGGCLPTLIQFPVLIGLYQSINRVLAVAPLQLVDLAPRVYLPALAALVPVNDQFLWLNLGAPDPYYILPVLVVVTTWAQQKLLSTPTADPQSQSMTQTMQYMMPLMFGFFALSFSAALSIYFVVSNLLGVTQYGIINRWYRGRWEEESEEKRRGLRKPSERRPASAEEEPAEPLPEGETEGTGKTVADAVDDGLGKLAPNLIPVTVEVLDRGRPALWGIGAQEARVRLVGEKTTGKKSSTEQALEIESSASSKEEAIAVALMAWGIEREDVEVKERESSEGEHGESKEQESIEAKEGEAFDAREPEDLRGNDQAYVQEKNRETVEFVVLDGGIRGPLGIRMGPVRVRLIAEADAVRLKQPRRAALQEAGDGKRPPAPRKKKKRRRKRKN